LHQIFYFWIIAKRIEEGFFFVRKVVLVAFFNFFGDIIVKRDELFKNLFDISYCRSVVVEPCDPLEPFRELFG